MRWSTHMFICPYSYLKWHCIIGICMSLYSVYTGGLVVDSVVFRMVYMHSVPCCLFLCSLCDLSVNVTHFRCVLCLVVLWCLQGWGWVGLCETASSTHDKHMTPFCVTACTEWYCCLWQVTLFCVFVLVTLLFVTEWHCSAWVLCSVRLVCDVLSHDAVRGCVATAFWVFVCMYLGPFGILYT